MISGVLRRMALHIISSSVYLDQRNPIFHRLKVLTIYGQCVFSALHEHVKTSLTNFTNCGDLHEHAIRIQWNLNERTPL